MTQGGVKWPVRAPLLASSKWGCHLAKGENLKIGKIEPVELGLTRAHRWNRVDAGKKVEFLATLEMPWLAVGRPVCDCPKTCLAIFQVLGGIQAFRGMVRSAKVNPPQRTVSSGFRVRPRPGLAGN